MSHKTIKRTGTPVAAADTKRPKQTDLGTASHLAKCLYRPFRRVMTGINTDDTFTRLQSECMKLLSTDKTNPPGQRNLANCRLSRLKRFEFNRTPALQPFYFKCRSALTDDKKAVYTNVPGIHPSRDIIAPPGATHFRLIAGHMEIDLDTWHFHANPTIISGYHSILEPTTAFNFAMRKDPAMVKFLLVAVLGIKFYTTRAVELVEHADSNANSLIILSASFINPIV